MKSILCITAILTVVSLNVVAGEKEDAVSKRSIDRWNAQIEGRLEDAYKFYSPATRIYRSLATYKRETKGVGLWKKAKIDKVLCETEDRCVLNVSVDMIIRHSSMPGGLPTVGKVKEVWLNRNDQWWYMPPTAK
jgi:hypothetical protein